MNNARILLVFVFACTLFYAGAQVPNEPKPEEPVAKKVHWYDNLQIRGYMQIRYNRLLETNEKLNIDELKHSNRRYPAIMFKQEREAGKIILDVEKLSYTTEEGEVLFSDISLQMLHDDKITILSRNGRACTVFY